MQQQLRGNRFFFPKGKKETWNKSKLKGSVWHWIWWVLPTVPATQEAEMDCLSLECGNQHVQHSQTLLTKDKRPITWHFRKHSSYFQHNSFQRPRLTAQYMKTGTFTLLNTSPLMMKRHLLILNSDGPTSFYHFHFTYNTDTKSHRPIPLNYLWLRYKSPLVKINYWKPCLSYC